MIQFRPMTSTDVDLMVRFEQEARQLEPGVFPAFNEDKYRENFTKHNIESHPLNEVVLCFFYDTLIGRVDLIVEQSFMDFERVGYVDWVYVLKSYRNKGIAKQLFLQAEEYFKRMNCMYYYLFVAENNEAEAFYGSTDLEIKTIKRAVKKLT